MPNFLVTTRESNSVSNQTHGAKCMVIFAADAAGARLAAEGRLDGDGNDQWSDTDVTTVVELVVGTELIDAGDLGWSALCRIEGAVLQDDVTFPTTILFTADGKTRNQALGILGADRLHIGAIAIDDGGIATYVVDEILTAAGGTFTRAATFRITSVNTGVIDGIELVDPGEYSVLPSLTANAVTGGGGTVATMDLTQADPNSYYAILAQMVTQGVAAGLTSSIDLSEGGIGTRLFTVSTVGDAIGEATLTFEFAHNGTVEPLAVGTLVDEDVAAAVLTAAVAAIGWAPPRVHVFQHNPL